MGREPAHRVEQLGRVARARRPRRSRPSPRAVVAVPRARGSCPRRSRPATCPTHPTWSASRWAATAPVDPRAGRRAPSCPTARPRHAQRAAQRGDPVADVREAAGGRGGRSGVPMPRPSSVIAMRRCPLLRASPTDACVACGVLRGVRERLAHHVVGGRLDFVGVPLGAHRGRRPRRSSGMGNRATPDSTAATSPLSLSTGGWMPRASSRRSVSVSRAWSCSSASSSGGELAALQAVAGEPEPRDLRDDVLLDAVVQVALEPAALVVLRGDEPLARGGQLVELLGELRGQAHVGDGCRGLTRDRAQQRALGVAVLAAAARADARCGRASRRRARDRTTRPPGRPRHVAGDTHGRLGERAIRRPPAGCAPTTRRARRAPPRPAA